MHLEAAVDTLRREATTGGIAFDGLSVTRESEGFVVETPHERLTGLTEPAVADALAAVAEYTSNWQYWQVTVGGSGTARRAFLRWCERAPREHQPAGGTGDRSAGDASSTANGEADSHSDTHAAESVATDEADSLLTVPERYEALEEGIDRTWGELAITTRFRDVDEPDGERVYDLWHVADAGADVADLTVYSDPGDAREIGTYDERGNYRPLRTAPTLPTGWAFTGCSGDELVRAVDAFYPATIANWHRERLGVLDVDHWVSTAERQTGIYDVVDELPRAAVDWMAEACCDDSQCLKRRQWEYTDGDSIEVDPGDGPFPCREPCSLVVAAARQWAILEAEDSKPWAIELTTSELAQLGELVDAVADGRTAAIREADVADGANRYRARYLRAKRLDETSSLDAREGTETSDDATDDSDDVAP